MRAAASGRGGRETAAAERRRREGGTRAVGIDEHLLALVAERNDLHTAVGKEPQGFVHVEQRRVLDAQTPRRAHDKRHQGGDVGRARFEPHQLAAVGRAAVGVGENPVEAQSGPLQILLGRGVDDLYVGGLEPPEVFGGDTGQRFAAFERHHAPETAAQEERIDAQSAGEVQRRVAVDAFMRRARLARRLLEGQRREYALRAAYDGSFDAARARYLTCVATSRAWGTVRSRATSSGSRPRRRQWPAALRP